MQRFGEWWPPGGLDSLPPMGRLKRIVFAVAAGSITASLAAGPVVATESGQEQLPPGESQPVEEGERIPEESKAKFPLELDDPQGWVGLVLLALTGIGTGAAIGNMLKQLRGERPQASGRWRPR